MKREALFTRKTVEIAMNTTGITVYDPKEIPSSSTVASFTSFFFFPATQIAF